jgi:hypothetical protein
LRYFAFGVQILYGLQSLWKIYNKSFRIFQKFFFIFFFLNVYKCKNVYQRVYWRTSLQTTVYTVGE